MSKVMTCPVCGGQEHAFWKEQTVGIDVYMDDDEGSRFCGDVQYEEDPGDYDPPRFYSMCQKCGHKMDTEDLDCWEELFKEEGKESEDNMS